MGEVGGCKHSLEYHPFAAKWFYGVYAAAVVGAAALVGFAPDLVWLNIAAQVLNAFLPPPVVGFLMASAVKALPAPLRPRGLYLGVLIGVCALVIAVGLYSGVAGLISRLREIAETTQYRADDEVERGGEGACARIRA